MLDSEEYLPDLTWKLPKQFRRDQNGANWDWKLPDLLFFYAMISKCKQCIRN